MTLPSAVTSPRLGWPSKASRSLHVRAVAENLREELAAPELTGAGQLCVGGAPVAPLRVHLDDEVVSVEEPGVDQLDEGPEVSAAVLDVQDLETLESRGPGLGR